MKNFQGRFTRITLTSCDGLETPVKPHLNKPVIEQAGSQFDIRESVQGILSIVEDWSQDNSLMLVFHPLGTDVFTRWALTLCLSNYAGLDSYIMFKRSQTQYNKSQLKLLTQSVLNTT